jgi:hypothetical protein
LHTSLDILRSTSHLHTIHLASQIYEWANKSSVKQQLADDEANDAIERAKVALLKEQLRIERAALEEVLRRLAALGIIVPVPLPPSIKMPVATAPLAPPLRAVSSVASGAPTSSAGAAWPVSQSALHVPVGSTAPAKPRSATALAAPDIDSSHSSPRPGLPASTSSPSSAVD